MRVKVECGPPLPSTKAWFGIQSLNTISDLKATLCTDLPALRDAAVSSDEIVLFMDGFELLDTSLVDVLRDGDLIM